MKNRIGPLDIISIVIVTLYLVVYCILIQNPSTETLAIGMWIVSPVIIVWTVYVVLKHGIYKGKQLGEREYGYSDREI